MPTDKKLIFAVLVLAALGGAVFLQNKNQSAEMAAHSLEGASDKLPKITITDDDIKKIDKVELWRSGDTEGAVRENIVLVKKSEEDWDLEKPKAAKASASNVKSMIDDLKRIEVKELIDAGKTAYAKYKLEDDKALHAVFYKGKDVAFEGYFGEDGSRGQMTRIGSKDGVYAVKGYSSYLFNKDAKSWRDKTILKFEDKDVSKVTLVNENGTFTFEKSGTDWKAKRAKPKSSSASEIEKFDKSKLDSLVNAYKGLSAADFGDGKTAADTGLAEPKATLTFEGNGAKYVIDLGTTAEGTNRWAKKSGGEEIFSISSWAGDWATANVEKFQKTEEKKGDAKDKPPAGMPPGMPGMPPGMQGMPAGHPPVE